MILKTNLAMVVFLFAWSGALLLSETTVAAQDRGTSTVSQPAPGESAKASAPSTDDAKRQQLAKEYSRGNYVLYFVNQGADVLVLLIILMTGFSGRLRKWAERVTQRRWGMILIYSALFIALLAVLDFPLNYYDFLREKRYGFATQNFTGWCGDQLKDLGVTLVLGSLLILALYAVFKKAPRTWWLWGSGVLIGFTIFTLAISPVFIAPLFNKFEPLHDQALRQRILQMAHQQGIPADEVYQMDASRQSRHSDAYVAGLLGTQRIVLFDTIISNFTHEELEFVMGHEMGHYVLNHIWKGIAFFSALILLGMGLLYKFLGKLMERYHTRFGFSQLADVASVPLLLLLLTLYGLVLDPISNGFSRYQESQADRFGLRVAPHPEAAITAFAKFEKLDLAEADPPAFIEFWLYNHPSVGHRIAMAKTYVESQRSAVSDPPSVSPRTRSSSSPVSRRGAGLFEFISAPLCLCGK
jgi:STE24 endopeptidase